MKQKLLSLFREEKQCHHEILFFKLNYNNFLKEKYYYFLLFYMFEL